MQRKILLLTSALFLSIGVFAQFAPKHSVDLSTRMKKASIAHSKNTSAKNLDNGNFEVWVTDSFESMNGTTIRFIRPDHWAPVNGFFISYFLDIPIPISAVLNGSNSAAKIEVADMGYGSDLATIVGVDSRPTALKGQFQFNGADSSYAVFEVYATKFDPAADSSAVIGYGGYNVFSNTNGTYENFSAELFYFDQTTVPDTIYVFSTYLEGEYGTWLKFDNLSLDYSTTGINKTKSEMLTVYPNPSNAEIKVRLKDNTQLDNAIVEILALDGSLILKLDNYTSNQAIDISTLTSGLYILSVRDSNGVYTQKINKI